MPMTRNKSTRWMKRLFILGLFGSAAGYGGWYWYQHPALAGEPKYQVANVSRGEMVQVVTASGQLNPVVTVEVGSQISRNVNVAQTVAASLRAPILFVIANDLSKMQIEAEVAEADIGLVTVGEDVDFSVDALPGQIAHGKVKQIRYAPNTNQNVVTYHT